MYRQIENPVTGRKVNLYGSIGLSVLRQYLNQLYGGKPGKIPKVKKGISVKKPKELRKHREIKLQQENKKIQAKSELDKFIKVAKQIEYNNIQQQLENIGAAEEVQRIILDIINKSKKNIEQMLDDIAVDKLEVVKETVEKIQNKHIILWKHRVTGTRLLLFLFLLIDLLGRADGFWWWNKQCGKECRARRDKQDEWEKEYKDNQDLFDYEYESRGLCEDKGWRPDNLCRPHRGEEGAQARATALYHYRKNPELAAELPEKVKEMRKWCMKDELCEGDWLPAGWGKTSRPLTGPLTSADL